jgi:hypothetical protein
MRKSNYYARWLAAEEFESWDQLVQTSPQGTLFHRASWLQASTETFDVLGCFDKSGQLVGGIPAFRTKRFGFPISRLPYFVPYSGPVVRKIEGKYFNRLSTYKKIVEPLAQTLRETFRFAQVNIHYAADDIQPFLWKSFVPCIRHSYLVDLQDIDTALMEMDVDRRNDIRKGMRDGLFCEESEEVDEFLPLVSRSLQTQGVKWSEKRVQQFRDCYQASRSMDRGKLFFVRNGKGVLLGGAWLVWDQNRSYYLLTGMDRELGGRTAVPTMVWHMMRYTRRTLGLRWFDFEGADVPQIEGFVRAFGGRLVHCYVLIWISLILRPLWLMRQLLSWSW